MCSQLLGGHHVPHLLNMSHVIHHVSFGPYYPGQVNPLDGYKRILDTNFASFKYFLKVRFDCVIVMAVCSGADRE